MKIPIIVKNSRVPRWLSFVTQATAITIWPFIFTDSDRDVVIRHELIHIRQCNELLVLGFYLIYFFDFLRALVKHKDKILAYQMIRFEQEAYDMQDDVNYYITRKHFAWRKYKI